MRLLLALIAILLCPLSQAAPSRVVSLDLCMDWLLAYYARPAQVAALSPLHQRYPVAWLGDNWPAHDGSLEQIYALKPDQVVVGQYAASLLRKRLIELGIKVEVLPLPQTLEQVQDYERQILRVLGLPPERASQIPPAHARLSQKRLLLLGPNGIGTGTDTLENAILSRAGWRNYLQSPGYQSLDLEQLVSDPPDAILWAAPEHQALANQFAEHPALHRAVPAEHWLSTDYWRWQCPGPWTWELIGQLQQWLD
ncbi:ABC transporter substrate-binding protein [Pseudomonas sp. 5P_3.1_Bac2]|uniref:ABC transporter substrate-binding protein n=1 Tax=Pseudomonas sp. 5P_3.1_Bac2 TaxID=2971617 RepID=UPI0021C7547A|nr:ABC transporter substrate-binding protein [Pseudomonas sp. 5P_3.1_Bac2]MCU1719354.1 ABC transporter substrate-binding protein [Pseudomonas sp. 5P_3.1_Bac2]